MQTAQNATGTSQPLVGQPQPLGNKRVQLKLAMPHAIKKVRDMPSTAEDLRKLIAGNLQGHASGFTVEYEDTDGDKIAITDDDDLLLAYEGALEQTNGNLKLLITKVDSDETGAPQTAAKQANQIEDQDDENMSSSSSDSDDEVNDDFVVVNSKKDKKHKGRKHGHKKEKNKQHKMMKKIIKHAVRYQTRELLDSMQNQNLG